MSETIRRITFSLDKIRDAEILAWLDEVVWQKRSRSAVIRDALRAQVDGDHEAGGPDDQAERIACYVVDKLGEAGVLVSSSGGISRTPDVDPVVRENLAGLGA